jgi:hypothetical protein
MTLNGTIRVSRKCYRIQQDQPSISVTFVGRSPKAAQSPFGDGVPAEAASREAASPYRHLTANRTISP